MGKPGASLNDKINFTIRNNEICANEILENYREKHLSPIVKIQSNLTSLFQF